VINQAELKRLVRYSPDNGVFTWLLDRSDKVKAGGIAGGASKSSGYKRICIDYKLYPQHRLAFLYMEGDFPPCLVDHINGDRSDNRWCNLRRADDVQNAQNKGVRSDNTSGHIGVWKPKGRDKWVAQLCGKHIGYCATEAEAVKTYETAATKLYGAFYRPHTIKQTLNEPADTAS